MYVLSMVDIKCTKKKTTASNSRRSTTKEYYLKHDNIKERVCLKTFLHTLGIKEWTVRYWLGERPQTRSENKSSRNDNHNILNVSPPLKQLIKDFLSALPKLPSHYCRKSSMKLYLEPIIQSKRELYRLYEKDAKDKSHRVGSRKLFEDVLSEENISIFQPKKDECDLCCAHKVGNISEEDYQMHISRKNLARNEKSQDKERAKKGEIHVFTADLQAVKLCPHLKASALYFKTKLAVHNFTVYNLGNDDVVCYWFDETAADLKASTYATFYVNYLKRILNENPKDVVIYSDGCTSQNRNVVVSNAILRLAMDKNVVITQKFLEKGHTQMEVDSVHSVIERKLKNRELFLPSTFAALSKEARLKPRPYDVVIADHTFFIDYNIKENLIYDSIRPGRGAGENRVVDIRLLKYKPDGTIEYKLNFEDELQPLPRRPKKIALAVERILYSAPLPISESKYNHLQELKQVIPRDCHEFYDNLPFKN